MGWLDKYQNGGFLPKAQVGHNFNKREVPRGVVNDNIPNASQMAIKMDQKLFKDIQYAKEAAIKKAKEQEEAENKFKALPKAEQERILYEQYNQEHGSISEYTPNSILSKVGQSMILPFTALTDLYQTGEVRDNLIASVVNNPKTANAYDAAYLGTLGYATAPAIATGAASVSSAVTPYLAADAVVGGTTLTGVNLNNLITAGFATHGAINIAPDTEEWLDNPSWEKAGHVAIDALEMLSMVGPVSKTIGDWLKGYKEVPKPFVDFSKYLTQEEAIAARAKRLISQKNKPGWNEQLTPELEQRLSTAVERHNPASDYPGESLGANTMGRTATEVSRHPMNADKLNPNSRTYDPNAVPIYLNDANKARVAAHETGHYYSNSFAEGEEWLKPFNLNKLESYKTRTYLRGKSRSNNYANEIRERAAQLKDYIAQKNKIPLNQDFKITQAQLDDAIKNYVKDTGLDNTMSKMLGALKDKKGLLKTMNKYALGAAPVGIVAGALQQKKENGGWLDKFQNGGDVSFDSVQRAIRNVESLDGKLMWNPESTATGLYGQLFSQVKDDYSGTRKEFAKDTIAQKEFFKNRFFEGLPSTQTTPLVEDANDIYNEYASQIPNFNYSREDLAILSNFLGRQGTREYLGYHVRDNQPLEEALPNIYGSDAKQRNKTPEQYLEQARKYYKEGGWLDKYQTGGSLPGASGMMYSRNSGSSAMSPPNLTKAQDGTVMYGTPEYEAAYREGRFADVPNQLDEVVIDSGVDYDQYPRYDKLSAQQKEYINDPGPVGRGVRRAAQTDRGLAEDTYDVVNPIMYGALGVAGGMMAGPGIATLGRAAAPYVSRALNYTPFGGPVSVGNTIDAGSAAYAAYATPEAYDKFKENPSWDTGLDLGLTAIDLFPFGEIFTGFKGTRNLYNKGKNLLTNDLKPNPDMYYRGIGQAGLDDALQSGLLRAKPADQIAPAMVGPFDMAKRFNNLYVTPRLGVAQSYGKGVVAEVPTDVARFSRRYQGSDWSMMTDNQIPIENINLYKKNFFGNYRPVEVPSSSLSNMPWVKPNMWPTNNPLSPAMEPYLSRKVYPFNKEQEIFESFLPTEAQLKNINSKSIRYDADGNIIPNMEYGGEIDKAQWGRILKAANNLYDGVKGAKKLDNFKFKNLPTIEKKPFIKVVDDEFDTIDYDHLIPTTQEISDIATKTRSRLMSDKFIKNNMEATGRSKDEVVSYVDDYIKEFENSTLAFDKTRDGAVGLYTRGKITIDPRNPHLTKENVLGTLEHEIEHMFSNVGQQGSDLYRHPTLKLVDATGMPNESLIQNMSQAFEQQVRFRKALGWLEKNAGLKVGDDVTDEQVEALTDAIANWSKEGGKDFRGSGANFDIQHLFSNLDAEQFLKPGQFLMPNAPRAANLKNSNVRQGIKDILNKTYTVGAVGGLGAASQMTGPVQADGQFKNGGSLPKAQYGINGEFPLPIRKGVRSNYDDQGNVVGESSHIMRAETLDGKNWFSFPTLFQDKDGTWIDMSEQAKQNWEPVYKEAKKRGEVIEFGDDKEAAIKFGEGSWKSKMKHGGGVPKAQFGWLNKLYKMYKGTDKVVDAAKTTGKLKYVDELSPKAQENIYKQNYEALKKTDKETRKLGEPHIAQEEYGEGWKYSDEVDFNNPEEVAAHRKRWIASQKKGNFINDTRWFPLFDETSDIFSDLSRKDLLNAMRSGLDKPFSTIGNSYRTQYGHLGLDYEIDYLNDFLGKETTKDLFPRSIIRPDGFNSSDEAWTQLRENLQNDLGGYFYEQFKKPSKIDFGDLLKNKNRNGGWLSKYENGGVIEDDRGQWAHPGKVTKINSNNITMKGVNYPVLGISDTGDKKMMQPGKDYKFKGNSVTEFPMAQKGMNVEGQNQRKWFDSYIRSDKYLERLGKEFPEMNADELANERWARLMNMRSTPIGFLPESSDISPTPGDTQGVYNADEYPGKIMLRPEYSKGRQGPWSYNTIPLHEMGHAVDEGGKRIPQTTLDFLMPKLKQNYPDIPKERFYYTRPTEYINRLQPLRYLLQEEGIYDAKKKDFTKEDLQEAKENTRIKYNRHFKDLMENTESEEDFIELMNNIASVDNSRSEYPMAKDGKSLVELDQLTNFTNYNTPQPGGWLDKY